MQDVTFHSASLQREMPYRVILPANLSSDKRLPVVYLLHGGGGGYRDWSNYSDVARFAERGLILVMPEGNSSYYMNAREPRTDRYEDYIIEDLIADVETRFPATSGRENRAIVGLSMGGFGAVVLALKHPDLFAFAGGLSSALDVPTRKLSWRRMGQYRAHAKIFGNWGSVTRRVNNPYFLAESVEPIKTTYFYLTCGDQEGLLSANQRFAALLQKRGFKYEFHTGPGGHDWNQWNRRLPELFNRLQEHLAGGVGQH
jgi:S-formylglutathione hydrolase FrmB